MGHRERRGVLIVALIFWALAFGLAYARYTSFHNRTFDLAFYARMAWGWVHGSFWDPIVGASFFGLHISPILIPLGALGRLFGTVEVLVAAQALAAALAAWPLARLGARHLGSGGGLFAALLFFLHPNWGHVVTYEVHPGTMALLPLAFLVERLDAGDPRGVLIASLGAVACREDLTFVVALAAPLLYFRRPEKRAFAWVIGALATAYGVFVFGWVLPAHRPETGSFEAHFGAWGESLPRAIATWVKEPDRVLAHLLEPERRLYPLAVLGSSAFLPLLAPRLLILTLPVFGVALMSTFPTTTELYSHYLTPALPPLIGASLLGAKRLVALLRRSRKGGAELLSGGVFGVALLCVLFMQALFGGLPGARTFDAAAFVFDARSRAAEEAIAPIPASASLQAPDPLLAHLAERTRLHRGPPPERGTKWVVLDISHRDRYRDREDLLRTVEEPLVRAWLAREDHRLVVFAPPYITLAREQASHENRIAPHRDRRPLPGDETRLTSCLSTVGARAVAEDRIAISLRAHGPCPADLAVRLGVGRHPTKVQLLFDGALSPVHLRRGDRLISHHSLPNVGGAESIVVGALRSSGARPAPTDPRQVSLSLTRSP